MFFFEKEQRWRQYVNELGIQKAVDHLKSKGLPHEWPLEVPDLQDPGTLKAVETARSYKSPCPHYGGMWLCGGISGVECTSAGELLPGNVWDSVCKEKHTNCPFYKKEEL